LSIYRARAPLRLGLAGGGTDVAPFCDLFGGAVLNATINLFAHTTLAPGDPNCVRFISQDLGITEEFQLDQPLPKPTRLPLHRGVYLRMMKDFRGGTLEPLTLTTRCDVPIGSGLGASSTIVVPMLRAFDEAWTLALSPHALAQLAFDIERVDVGFGGGKQDQYAAAFGGFNFIQFQQTGEVVVTPLPVPDNVIAELEDSVILFYTGNSHKATGIISQESRNVREHNEPAIEAMHKTKEAAYAMTAALLRGEVSAMGEIMKQAWVQKKRMADGITNPSIDSLYAAAMRAGAYCGKVSGAGGGGYMMFLVDPARRKLVEAALTKTNRKGIAPCNFIRHGAQAWRAR
jgi:D-glycero-alpha-D-manno-heptose-7-phosphate kinase